MIIKLNKTIIIMLIFIFVLTIFSTISFAAQRQIEILRGEDNPKENQALKDSFGFNPEDKPVEGDGDRRGKWQWRHNAKNYILRYETERDEIFWILYEIEVVTDNLDVDEYKTGIGYDEASYVFEKGGKVLGLLRRLAAIISLVVISIIGVRYMMGSVEQKAEYKQTMGPVVIGCILIGGLSGILTIIQSIF